MSFEGHQLYKIDDKWLFDLTTFIGYEIDRKNNKQPFDYNNIKSMKKMFVVSYNIDSDTYEFDKYEHTPVCIMRKVTNIINAYRKEALLGYANR